MPAKVVGDMLSPDEFSGWCSVLADDRSMNLVPGKVLLITSINMYGRAFAARLASLAPFCYPGSNKNKSIRKE